MTEREKDNYIAQLLREVSKWHHAYDALLTERYASRSAGGASRWLVGVMTKLRFTGCS